MSGVAILYVEICAVYRNMYGLIYIFMDLNIYICGLKKYLWAEKYNCGLKNIFVD